MQRGYYIGAYMLLIISSQICFNIYMKLGKSSLYMEDRNSMTNFDLYELIYVE